MKNKLLPYFLVISFAVQAQEPLQDYIFFANSRMSENYFYTKTIFQSPSFIKNEDQKLPVNENIFFTPGNSLQLEYVNAVNGKWDALIYRPEIRAQDHFKTPRYLSFHLYSASGTTSENLPAIQLMSTDSVLSKKCFFQMTKANSWEHVIILIDSFGIKIKNAPDITTVVFSQRNNDGKKHTIYIDDIEFLSSMPAHEVTEQPIITEAKGCAKHIDIKWKSISDTAIKYVKIYRAIDEKNYQPIGIQLPIISRYADFTGETGKSYRYKISFLNNNYQETNLSAPVSAQTRPLTDDELF